MKYRLKDRALQEKLDAISDGDFSKQLQDAYTSQVFLDCLCVNFGGEVEQIEMVGGLYPGRLLARFHTSEIEEVHEYDPKRWNEWPNKEPPRNKLMRVEVLTERIDWDTPEPRGGKVRFRGCGFFDGREWYFYGATTRKEGETVRFRPWDDTTATLNKKILQEIIKALESHPEAYDLGYLIDDVTEAANELPDEEEE